MGKNYEPPISNVAERLKEAMDLRSVTAADLSRTTGITTASLSHYLNGRYVPKQDKLYLLSKQLRVSPVWLMGFDAPMEMSVFDRLKQRKMYETDGTPLNKLVSSDKELTRAEWFNVLHKQAEKIRDLADQLEETEELCKNILHESSVDSVEDRKLIDSFHKLSPDRQATVLSNIEFLLSQQEEQRAQQLAPNTPEQEEEVTP